MDDVHPAYRGQGELQFLKIIAEEIENAEYRPGTTFTKESERYVFRRFRTKLGPIYSDRFLRSRFKTIKKRYLEFTEMISKPGLYWDKKNNIVSGNEELLRAEYMHRRRNGLYYGEQHYDLMCQIFGSEVKFE